MKSVTIIYNGVADQPVRELSGRTPLEVVRARNACQIAIAGQAGMLDLSASHGAGYRLLAELLGMPETSIDALTRGPLWAASLGEDLRDFNFAYCATFVTLDKDDLLAGPCVESLRFEETQVLAAAVEKELAGEVRVRAVAPAQVVVLCRSESAELNKGHAPGLNLDVPVDKYVARFKKESQRVAEWMQRSATVLATHSVNEVRLDLGENPANFLWLWDGGSLLPVAETSPNTTLLTNSPTAAGLAATLNIHTLELDEPWNMEAESDSFHMPDVVCALRDRNQLVVYVEAPGCTFGPLAEKLHMLEAVDYRLLAPLDPILKANRPYRIALLSDGIISTESGEPVAGSVPFVIAGEGISKDEVQRWSEADCQRGLLETVPCSTLRHMMGL